MRTTVRNAPRLAALALLSISAIPAQAAGTAGMAGAAGAATESRVLTPEQVLKLRSVADVAISPDGKFVAYRVDVRREGAGPREGGSGTLWVVPAAGGEPKRVTEAGHAAQQPRWSPDGGKFSWIAQANVESAAQVFVQDRAGGSPVAVTSAPGGVSTFEWSPQGDRIAYTSWDVKTAEQKKAEAEGRDWIVMDASPLHSRLYTVPAGGGSATLVSRAELTVYDFDWSPDGRRFAFGAAASPSVDDRELAVQVYVVDAGGGDPKRIVEHRGRLTMVRWSGDGRSIAWLMSISLEDPYAGSLFVMPADGSGPPRNLMPGYDGTATWLGPSPGRPRSLTLLIEEHMRNALRTIDLDTGRMEPLLASQDMVVAGSPSFASDGRTFAFAANSASHPNEAFISRGGRAAAPRRLSDTNPWLRDVTLAKQEVTRWKSKDGLEIEGLLIRPVGYVEGRRYPIVLHVHGGSEGIILDGWQSGYHNFGQALAARGYAVLYPNYRGSRGRGTNFVRGNRHDLMGREWEDIEGALDHAIAVGVGDGDKAGIYGFSWGGYAAGWGATYASHRFKAAVGGAGIYNWISEAGSNDSRLHEQFTHWDSPLYDDFLIYLDRSPIYHIRRAQTPTLLLHGEMDQSCPIGQAIEMHTALKWKGVPVEFVMYPREGHGMAEPEHQADFQSRALGWFDKYLSPPR
jgi:dipeptidyl aminopeptidase/acylaminoacyl peptidase